MDKAFIYYRVGLQPSQKKNGVPLFLTNFRDLSQPQTTAMHDFDESNCHDVSF
jgi:hypothetical protein